MKLDVNKVPKLKPNPIFKGLSSSLKDPTNYLKTEDSLQSILKSDHKHKTASSYVKCEDCQTKYNERKKLMKKIGFKSIQQYMEWKKIMTIIINKKNFQLK